MFRGRSAQLGGERCGCRPGHGAALRAASATRRAQHAAAAPVRFRAPAATPRPHCSRSSTQRFVMSLRRRQNTQDAFPGRQRSCPRKRSHPGNEGRRNDGSSSGLADLVLGLDHDAAAAGVCCGEKGTGDEIRGSDAARCSEETASVHQAGLLLLLLMKRGAGRCALLRLLPGCHAHWPPRALAHARPIAYTTRDVVAVADPAAVARGR